MTSSGGNDYTYDANGNMITREAGTQNYTLTYNAEGRLTGVSGSLSATFTYDGDGQRVKQVIGGVTTYFVGNYFAAPRSPDRAHLLPLIWEGFLLIGGKLAITEVVGWKNPPKPISIVLDNGRAKLIKF